MTKTMKTKCINASKCTGLTEGKEYKVKEAKSSQYWSVKNDNGEVKCYHKTRFEELAQPASDSETSMQTVEVLDPVKLTAQLEKATDYIQKEVGNVAKSFCRIGFKLWEVREQKQYIGKEYKNVYEYAEHVLGFKKASTANYIAVCERFSVRKDNKPTSQLLPNFASFSYTQLSEMLPLSDEVIADITPDATCKDIREIKKGSKGSSSGSGKHSKSDEGEEQTTLEPQSKDINVIFDQEFNGVNFDIIHAALFDCIGYHIKISVEKVANLYNDK